MPRKDFEDSRRQQKMDELVKARRLTKAVQEVMGMTKRETQEEMEKHRLGWITRDGKEL